MNHGTGVVGTSNVTDIQVVCQDSPIAAFSVTIAGSGLGFGDLALDGSGALLVVRPVRPAIVRVDRSAGAQSVVTDDFTTQATAFGVAHDVASDTTYASTSSQIFRLAPDGTAVSIALTSQLNAIAVAPPQFGDLGGFLVGVTGDGQITVTEPSGDFGLAIGVVAGPLTDLAFAPDGTLYVSGGSSIYRVTTGGALAPFASVPGLANGIAVTPDGQRLFVADPISNAVFQIFLPDPSLLAFAAIDLPDNGAVVQGILAAPDHRLYVVTGQPDQQVIELAY